jgi:hypothetical protein
MAAVVTGTTLVAILIARAQALPRMIYCGVVYHSLVGLLEKAVALHRLHRRHLDLSIARQPAMYGQVSRLVQIKHAPQLAALFGYRLHPRARLLYPQRFSSCSSSFWTWILTLAS